MSVLSITNLQAILILLALGVMIWYVLARAPSSYQPKRETFTLQEIQSYDQQVPRYLLVGTAALILGGLHAVLKNLPGLYQWFWLAGYGGHLARDAANSHIIIMGGGTILLIGLTWYVLPRIAHRPIYSKNLATLSLWLMVIGILGSYLSWIVLGLIEGSMVAQGWQYEAAKDYLGLWHKLPVGGFSGLMGVGFWLYVTDVFITISLSNRVALRTKSYLLKFPFITALAFLIGTIQGVVQVMPDNTIWLQRAGKFGEYIEPISHVHMNLLGGMMVTLAVLLLYFSERLGGKPIAEKTANRLFWTFVPAVFLFYLVLVALGLIVGHSYNGFGGIDSGSLFPLIFTNARLFLAIAGFFLLAAFWTYFLILWHSLGIRSLWEEVKTASPKSFWLVSSLVLVIGTIQGVLQILPASAQILTRPEEIPGIHAQFNMIGGIVLALVGVIYMLLPELTGQEASLRMRRFSLIGIGGGIFSYYLASLSGGLVRLYFIRQGLTASQSAEKVGYLIPALLSLTALITLFGFLAYGKVLWNATHAYRLAWAKDLNRMPARYNGKATLIRQHIPLRGFIAVEAIFGVFGFPGMGWLFSGDALIGMPLLIFGSICAWVVMPILLSVYGTNLSPPEVVQVMIYYLVASMLLSVSVFTYSLYRYKNSAKA